MTIRGKVSSSCRVSNSLEISKLQAQKIVWETFNDALRFVNIISVGKLARACRKFPAKWARSGESLPWSHRYCQGRSFRGQSFLSDAFCLSPSLLQQFEFPELVRQYGKASRAANLRPRVSIGVYADLPIWIHATRPELVPLHALGTGCPAVLTPWRVYKCNQHESIQVNKSIYDGLPSHV